MSIIEELHLFSAGWIPVGIGTLDALARHDMKSSGGFLFAWLDLFKAKRVLGEMELSDWIESVTGLFVQHLQASCAIIIHNERNNYYVNGADFSFGQFAENTCFGTKDVGCGTFDAIFSTEQEETLPSKREQGPANGVYVPDINSDGVVVFKRSGKIGKTLHDVQRVKSLLIDDDYQNGGSVMIVPIIAGPADRAERAVAYLYSERANHFRLPRAGRWAYLLAEVVGLSLRSRSNV
jgi:hypothetical protein